jgi:hypothetical protein
MKRSFVVALIIILALSSSAWAMPGFGIRAGANLANMTMDPKPNGLTLDMRTGLYLGGSAEMLCRKVENLAFRGELAYVMKGTEAKSGGVKSTYMADEVVIAPFVVYKFPQPKFTPFVEIGPELGINVQHKVKTGGVTSDIQDYSSTNVGLNVGVGCGMPIASGEGTIDLRYNLGLTNMYTGSGSGTWKTNGIQIVLGYNFTMPTK